MGAMLRASIQSYPGTLAGLVAIGMCVLFVGLAYTIYRKRARAGFEYASRLPLDEN